MYVYFDKPNLVSFLAQRKDKRFRYCEETLLNHCKVFMNFSKDKLGDTPEEDEIILNWMKACTEGFDTEPWTWDTIFPVREIKSNTPKNFNADQHSAVYLITDKKLHLLKDKNQYLVADVGDEIDALSQLWFDDRQYLKNIFDKLDKWSKLIEYQSPCSDIIIFDKFLLLDKNLWEFNLYALLNQLSFESICSKMNVVIFSLKDNLDKTCDFEKAKDTIKRLLEKKTGHKPFVTIVTGSNQKLGEHDRTIFTNYKLYTSGDSFNYFDSNGNKITKGRTFHVYSLVSKENEATAKGFLRDMQALYDSIKKDAPDNIYKDANCESNFLKL